MVNVDVGWRIDVYPAGLRYKAAAPCVGCAPAALEPFKHGFAGLTALKGSILVDGLNDAGLGAGTLWLETHPFELLHK